MLQTQDQQPAWRIRTPAGIALLSITATLLFVFGLRKLTNFDIWWHLAAGRYIIENRTIPRVDMFSFTRQGNPWIDLHWGFQILVQVIYSISGSTGLIILRILALFAAFGAVISVSRPMRNPLAVSAVFCLAILSANSNFLIRPIILTVMFLAFNLAILIRWQGRDTRLIYLLPVVQLLWVNIHSLFVLGLFTIYCFSAGAFIRRVIRLPWDMADEHDPGPRFKQMVWVAGLSTVICLLNPFHWQGLTFPFQLFLEVSGRYGAISRYTSEFAPPLSGDITSMHIRAFSLLLVLSAASFVLNYRRLKPEYLMTWIGFAYLALVGGRNLSVFAITAAPITVLNLTTFSSSIRHRLPLGLRKVMTYSMVLVTLAGAGWIIDLVVTDRYFARYRTCPFGLGIHWHHYPRGAAEFIAEHEIPGPGFNTFEDGGYLIHRLYPELQVFIDGRNEVSGSKFFNHYVNIITNPRDWENQTAHHKLNFALIKQNHSAYFPLLVWFATNPYYAMIYQDQASALFVPRRTPFHLLIRDLEIEFKDLDYQVPLVEIPEHMPGLWQRLTTKVKVPLAELAMARAYTYVDMPNQAMKYYTEVIKVAPDLAEAYQDLGAIMLDQGKLEPAEKYLEQAIKLDQKNTGALNSLAKLAENRADRFPAQSEQFLEQAEKHYRKALSAAPGSGELLNSLAMLYFKQGKLDLCIEYLERARKIKYFSEPERLDINQAHAYMALGHCEKALPFLDNAIELAPTNGKPYYLKGIALKARGQNAKAEQLFEKAALDPEFKQPPPALVQEMVNQCRPLGK